MAREVFISYAADDRLAADAVCSRLEHAGFRCWIAPRDVVPGSEWASAIVEAIGAAPVFVLVFSAHTNASRHVRREVELAIQSGQIVVPFRIEAAEPEGSLRYYIADAHWLDAITPPLERHLSTLVHTIGAVLGRPVTPSPVAPVAAPAAPEAVATGELRHRGDARRPIAGRVALALAVLTAGIVAILSFMSADDRAAGVCDAGLRWRQPNSPYIDGATVMSADGSGAAIIVGGARLNFPSAEEYRNLVGEKPPLPIARREFDALGSAPRDGVLLRERAFQEGSGRLFLSEGGAVYLVRDEKTVGDVGLSLDAAVTVPSQGLDGSPRKPPTGTLLRRKDVKTVWVMDGGARRPSDEVCAGARINVLPSDPRVLDEIPVASPTRERG